MSSFVTSDHTVLAIVEGMRKYGLIEKEPRPSKDMAEALRFMNEYRTTKRYNRRNTIDDFAIARNHREVTATPRKFSDGEVLAAIKCWLYQIDTGEPMDFDFLTIFESVKLLEKRIVASMKESGTLEVRHWFGSYQYYILDPDMNDFIELHERYGWDLGELQKAA